MAWITIESNPEWEYDNSIQNRVDQDGNYITYRNSPGTISNGIRTYTNESGNQCQVYIRCRQKSNPERILGEVSKTYWDNQS